MQSILIKDKKQLKVAVRRILECISGQKIIAFYGQMGAGKTTIIKAICKLLGATDLISSPTFTIINEYRRKSESALYHIDLYRIKKAVELYDIGIEEYLSGTSYCFIEWPELVEDMLPEGSIRVDITVGDNEQRILRVS